VASTKSKLNFLDNPILVLMSEPEETFPSKSRYQLYVLHCKQW